MIATRHKRKTIRLKDYDYSQPGEYFITICTYNKVYILGEIVADEMRLSREGIIAQQYWRQIPSHFKNVELDEYTKDAPYCGATFSGLRLPNHLHGILILCEHTVGIEYIQPLQKTFQHVIPNLIPSIIRSFKAAVTLECSKMESHFHWQRNYYEHIIRGNKDLDNIRDYITGNVLKWAFDSNRYNDINYA
jgi:hypothetical protein